METLEIMRMPSPYRGDFIIRGYHFGPREKSIAIVGSLRGDEVQQLYVASQIVKNLRIMEADGNLSPEHGILVIPTANPFSLNVMKRFWTMDNTDINRMFPGYGDGETTQRIAEAIFDAVRDYHWGVQLASYYMNGNFVPHVRIMHTGYEDTSHADAFGLPYVLLYEPRPYDTTVLNYNWQVFGTSAYSVYCGSTDIIHHDMAKLTWQSVLRFTNSIGATHAKVGPAYRSDTFDESRLLTVKSAEAGILYLHCSVGQSVRRGDCLAQILDPLNGETLQRIEAPTDASVFFAHTKPLVYQDSRLFQLLS